ncbi:MAG: hypothetical protein ACT4NY_02340 [Pseudonocardiales bacterium]
MSRHVLSANTSSDNSLRSQAPPQHLGIFAATVRALKGLAGRPSPAPAEIDLPEPRPAPELVEPPPSLEEITVELPRYVELEPTEPALSMLSKGRHSMW